MSDRSSRHRDAPTYRAEVRDKEVELLEPRVFPLSVANRIHRVTGEDRLDLLAHHYFGDPHQYWRIADANPTELPEDLLDPGRSVTIPGAD